MSEPGKRLKDPQEWSEQDYQQAAQFIQRQLKSKKPDPRSQELGTAVTWYRRNRLGITQDEEDPVINPNSPARGDQPPLKLNHPETPADPAADPEAEPAAPASEIDSEIADLEAELNTPVDMGPKEKPIFGEGWGTSALMGSLDGWSMGLAGDAFGLGASLANPMKHFDENGDIQRFQRDPRSPEPTITQLGDTYRDDRDAAYAANPEVAIGSDIMGGVLSGLPLGAIKGVQGAFKAAPVLSSALMGLLTGGIQGAGKARSGQGVEGAVEGGLQGLSVGGVLGVAGDDIARAATSLVPKVRRGGELAEGHSSGMSGADINRAKGEGSTTLTAPETAPDGTVVPAGTKLKGQVAGDVKAQLGRDMREQGLTGPYEQIDRKAMLTKHVAAQRMDALADQLDPLTSVDLQPLGKSLLDEANELAAMPNSAAAKDAEAVFKDFGMVSQQPYVDFKRGLQLRRYLDKRAYTAAGQNDGVAAEKYVAMATELRKALDKALNQAPPDLAQQMRTAMKSYEVASDAGRFAGAADANAHGNTGRGGEGRGIAGRMNAAVDRAVGNAPSRTLSAAAQKVEPALEAIPPAMAGVPSLGARTEGALMSDEELEELRRTQASLPR